MPNIIERRDYVDGEGILHADIFDTGRVRLSSFMQGDMVPTDTIRRSVVLTSDELRELADRIEQVQVKR